MLNRRTHIKDWSVSKTRVFLDRSGLFYLALSTLFVGTAFACRMFFDAELGTAIPFTFFVTASILSAAFGGWKAGVYSMILGWFLGDWFFVAPKGAWGHYGTQQWIAMVANFLPNLIAILALEMLHHSRQARVVAEAALARATQEIRQQNQELEKQVQRRTAELQSSLNFLEKFCYSIGHDLRAPLRAIRGFALALDEDYGSKLDATARQYTNRLANAVEKMDRLITDLLDYGRLSHRQISFEETSVADCLKSVLKKQKTQLEATQPHLEMRNIHFVVVANAQLLEEILERLLSNALKFRNPDLPPRIVFSCEETHSSVRISCWDNGIGISAQHLEKIFGLFETLGPTMGAGAGLAFIKKAVERMHGTVGVSSTLGIGSTFWIELPKGTSVEAFV